MRLISDQSVPGRQVTTIPNDPVMDFLRVLMVIVVGAGLLFLVLVAIFGPAPAEAAQPTIEQQKRAFVQMNDQCRGGAGGEWACPVRDQIAGLLKAKGTCYNPRSATPATAWVPCAESTGVIPEWRAQEDWQKQLICSHFATAAMRTAQDRDVGMAMNESHHRTLSVMGPAASRLGFGGFVLIRSIPDMIQEIYAGRATPVAAAAHFRGACEKLSGL